MAPPRKTEVARMSRLAMLSVGISQCGGHGTALINARGVVARCRADEVKKVMAECGLE